MYEKHGKYVTGLVRDFSNRHKWVDRHVALLLPLNVNHDAVEHVFVDVKSAGFFVQKIEDGKIDVWTHGRSETLDTDSAPGDTDLVRKALGIISALE